jgi:hypothetical protein
VAGGHRARKIVAKVTGLTRLGNEARHLMRVCNPADCAQEERAMTNKAKHVLASAFLAAGLSLLADDAAAAWRGQAELINRPTSPFACQSDGSHGRRSTCDRENANH